MPDLLGEIQLLNVSISVLNGVLSLRQHQHESVNMPNALGDCKVF